MEILPNIYEESFKKKLNHSFNSLEDINKVFFRGSANFFNTVSNNFPKIGKEFIKFFPQLINLIKELDTLFPDKGVKTLKKGENDEIKLTRRKVALIFLLSFLDLINIPENHNKNDFNVSYLLYHNYGTCFHFALCFMNYLTVIGKWLLENNKLLDEEIIYKRKNINSTEYFENMPEEKLCELNLINTKESLFNGNAAYCIDFANKYIGGGVLSGGCVQEEILFAVEPEAIVSLFFMEVMDDCDAIGIYNTIQYSDYTGYGFNFEYKGCLIDDKNPITMHRIIAIDAIPAKMFYSYNNDAIKEINRDIHKAFVGFNFANDNKELPKIIATGNWGCGAFNGNHELKFIQQWIAASLAKLDRLDYYTFGDKNTKNIEKFFKTLKEKYKNVNDLYNALRSVSSSGKDYLMNLIKLKS